MYTFHLANGMLVGIVAQLVLPSSGVQDHFVPSVQGSQLMPYIEQSLMPLYEEVISCRVQTEFRERLHLANGLVIGMVAQLVLHHVKVPAGCKGMSRPPLCRHRAEQNLIGILLYPHLHFLTL